jgi:polyhydroxybutyrate depolymerase
MCCEVAPGTVGRRRRRVPPAVILALALLVPGCAPSPPVPGPPPAAGTPAVPAPAAGAPAAGTPALDTAAVETAAVDVAAQDASCGAAAAGRSATHTITVAGRPRRFIQHVPAGIDTAGPRPVVLAFPGRGESAEQLEGYSGLDAEDVIVLYLQGLPGRGGRVSWKATPYLDGSAHDYELTAALVAWVQRASCVDRARVDLTGKSDGAGFAASAACSLPDIAAVATVAGAFYSAHTRCRSDGPPLPLLNLHGTADTVVPYDGDTRRGLLGTDAWVARWRTRDRCPDPPVTTDGPPGLRRQAWSGCADGTAVVNDRLAGGGHTWPGADEHSGPGPTSTAVSATRTMVAFFADHPRHVP